MSLVPKCLVLVTFTTMYH